MVGRPDFPLILAVKSDRVFCANLTELTRYLSFGYFLKDFFFLLELGMKDIFHHNKG